MSYHLSPDWRNRRNQYYNNSPQSMFQNYSLSKFSTDVTSNMAKSEINETFLPETYFDPLNLLEDPLERTLSNRMTQDMPISNFMYTKPIEEEMPSASTMASIGSFFSGVMNVLSAVMPFPRRTKVEKFDVHSGSPPLDFWLPAKSEGQPNNKIHSDNKSSKCNDEMSVDCSSAVTECELKLNQVKELLNAPYVGRKISPTRQRRPKKVFVDPKSIEETFEDALSYETIDHLAINKPLDYVSVANNMNAKSTKHKSPILTMRHKIVIPPAYRRDECKDQTVTKKPERSKEHTLVGNRFFDSDKKQEEKPDAPNKTNGTTKNNIENVIDVPEIKITPYLDKAAELKKVIAKPTDIVEKTDSVVNKSFHVQGLKTEAPAKMPEPHKEPGADLKIEVIQSCEDKLSKLKALLHERRAKNKTDLPPIVETPIEPSELTPKDSRLIDKPIATNGPIHIANSNDKHFKNPSRTSDRRKKCTMKQNIQEDLKFGTEINSDSLEGSSQCEPCYFNEVKGRFHKTSTTDSEDSFQIVFTDSPQSSPKARTLSDCDSEDSFIVFEDTPDSCYTSADVFGETDSEYESDSDHALCRLNPQYSRTISDLTQDSLYDDMIGDGTDDVDSGAVMSGDFDDDTEPSEKAAENKGLILTEAKKLARKGQPAKHVSFSPAPPRVKVMRVWAFASRQARVGNWERHTLDRERFKRRIADVDMAISWVLKPQHRSRVKFQRFMPWWHKQRRAELAEKKRLAEEEKMREEEEKRREEEQRREEEERRSAETVEVGGEAESRDEDVGEEKVNGTQEERKIEEARDVEGELSVDKSTKIVDDLPAISVGDDGRKSEASDQHIETIATV